MASSPSDWYLEKSGPEISISVLKFGNQSLQLPYPKVEHMRVAIYSTQSGSPTIM